VSDDFDIDVSPEPTDQDREAILAVVRETLRLQAHLARPTVWRLAGWIDQRVGLSDLDRSLPPHRSWALSSRLPRGGRVFGGLNGRGDAK
jgi:hypothetical protein